MIDFCIVLIKIAKNITEVIAMFSQRKKFYETKLFYISLGVCVFAFGIWMNAGPSDEQNSKEATRNTPVAEYQQDAHGNQKSNTDEFVPEYQDSEEDVVEEEDEEVMISEEDYPCYLVQEQDGLVKVFYFNSNGESHLVRTTAISFSLLSEGDQILFEKGIVKKTEDDLIELLQDFES